MGTQCSIKIYAKSTVYGKRVVRTAIKELKRLNDRYTRYDPNSYTSYINRSAGNGEAIRVVDKETCAILDYAATCHAKSGGLFDITSGVLRKAWDFSKPVLPSQKKLDELLPLVGWHKVKWKRPNITLPIPGMEIDFGGVVKEYAADTAASICIKAGIKHGVVEMGGDIRIIGPLPNNEPWHINVQHPRKPNKKIVTINAFRGGISTSGDYERYTEVNGERYYHILNPFTGWPVKGFASVTVLADFCVVAGSASTIAMLKGKDCSIAWLDELGAPYWCSDQQGNLVYNRSQKSCMLKNVTQ